MWNRQNIFVLLSTITTTTVVTYSYLVHMNRKKKKKEDTKINVKESYDSLIGNTPLFYLHHASKHKNVKLYVKLESSNPGGTGKDRAAYYMLRHAEQNGQLPNPNNIRKRRSPKDADNQETTTTTEEWKMCQLAMEKTRTGGIVVEGTSGSTGISLATLCASRGHACMIVMPDDQSKEKQNLLQTLGAILYVVPTASISNPNHYVNIARRMTQMINDYNNNDNMMYQACFIDQFENLANFQAHYEWTGPELMQQLASHYDDNNMNTTRNNHHLLFCMSSGTGGTLAGVGKYLTEQIIIRSPSSNTASCFSKLTLALVDPPGSALYNKVKYGVAYTSQQREQHFIKNQYNTIAEGIGLDRVTANFALALPYLGHNAVTVSDQTAVDVAHYLYQYYGLFVGSSSAMNVAALLQLSSSSSSTENLVGITMICDTGQRHVTRFWNRDFIVKEWKLQWPLDDPIAWKERLKPYIDLP